jgi:hypothetical protein
MNRIRQAVSLALVVAMLGIGMTAAQAQYRTNNRQLDYIIRRIENHMSSFRVSFGAVVTRSRFDTTADQLNGYEQNFEAAVRQLRNDFNNGSDTASDAQNVLQQAAFINDFMMRNRPSVRASNDWTTLRADLDSLARAQNISWDWTRSASTYGQSGYGNPTMTALPYRIGDRQLDALLRRIANESDTFRNDLGSALDRSTYGGTRAEDNINQFVSNFADATAQLRSRFDARQTASSDVENVLRQATYIDDFMRRNRVSYRASNDWTTLKGDLNQLASAYNVTWNWDVRSMPNVGNGTGYGTGYGTGAGYGARARLTGTYRLDPSSSDDANAIADRATRNLPYEQRQQVRDQVMRRLVAPDMIAIERNGSNVTIASSRAPRTTFVANGVENREQLPNGRYSQVIAQLNGDQLTVRSAGNRETDFSVTFDPFDGGQRLRVTRQIWNDQLGQNPVVVQNVYVRTSDVAQWDVYNGSTPYGQTGSVAPSGSFVVPDGTMLNATLDTDLSTQTANTGDRFAMTVNSPAQFAGAVIEGHVADVTRSGRVTGRSTMSLNFDDIRMPDGRTYQFAGFLDTVTTANGETVNVDSEGTVRDRNQTTQTEERAAIGTAVGAIIGAIAGGGKGAAIGAILGAGAGAGSVYVQGRDDLNMMRGTNVTIRASAPNR